MRNLRPRVPVLAAVPTAVLLATTGSAQAATGAVEFWGKGENITNPVDGKCYTTQNVNSIGQRDVVNNTNRRLKVFITGRLPGGQGDEGAGARTELPRQRHLVAGRRHPGRTDRLSRAAGLRQ
ncbi:hypothetical protein J7E91_15975 [Streptomyces sp. ISL-99]|uniref:hypothetical protein n=1 Tax=Streptomyces sp. ISL-99 TaxID=2819193 RepID=UPI001BED38CB|nr:hypothetical protein [Streptomyces sp. ISL-99]MBT2526883.1 hypothetical protein [Streptomyces sp. ISL-99]